MSAAPHGPYPPDLDDEPPAEVEFGDLVGFRFAKLQRVAFRDCRMAEADFYGASLEDVVFERCELRQARLAAERVERVDLIGCDLAGATGVEALRGARMPWDDVLAAAPAFAAALGIEIVEEPL